MLTLISISLSFTKSQWLSFSTKRTNTERHEYSSRDSGGPFSYSLHIRLLWCPNNVVFSPCFTPSFSAWPSFSNDFNMPSVTPSASLPLKSRNVKPPQETDNSACTYTPSWVIKLNQSNFFSSRLHILHFSCSLCSTGENFHFSFTFEWVSHLNAFMVTKGQEVFPASQTDSRGGERGWWVPWASTLLKPSVTGHLTPSKQ